jgi:hypothetical protein
MVEGPGELKAGRYQPVSDGVFARLQPILQAGDINPSRDAAEQLDAIARYSLQIVAHRDRPSRPRPTLRKYRRRPSDPPRERLIRRRGRPAQSRDARAVRKPGWLLARSDR